MTYKSDFEDDAGWSAIDTNSRLDTANGKQFRDYLRSKGVSTVIRYYASTSRPKTITTAEAQLLSDEGFGLLPVFQDRNREVADFGAVNGRANAKSALSFAANVAQPLGTTIVFAADADFSAAETKSHIIPYFKALNDTISGSYRIGAYGSGLVLQELLDEGLIAVPWISMSRGFRGTESFFYSSSWALRQVPPDRTHAPSGISYDRNILKWSPADIGVFSVGQQTSAGDHAMDAHLGQDGAGSLRVSASTDATRASRADGTPPTHFVSTEGLNFRVEPDGEIIRPLTIGEPVIDLGASSTAGWRSVSIGGVEGFVFGKYLRRPMAESIESLLQATIAEWLMFEKGKAREDEDPYYRYVGAMWEAIGEDYDGRSRYPNGEEVPWSAAFISWVVRKSGAAYSNFRFASSHSVFSNDAIQARVVGRTNRPFWGYRRSERRPEIGDIIHRNRGAGAFTFDYAENHSNFISHSDVVVEVTSSVARVIGGNVGDTVSMRSIDGSGDNIQEYNLDSNGFIADGQRVIAILKNRSHEVTI